jgi:alkanesulfonate monooxygenase SsuD/methylene tetrahydromethanopterin reductase-like flavin-dependent oxidoreductase (luciferase family)
MIIGGSRPASEGLDHGRTLEFGFFPDPAAQVPAAVLDTARLLDQLGYDLIGVQDHPYQAAHLDTQSLLGVILAQTSNVRVFADVANLPLRSPAVLAKAAATLDLGGVHPGPEPTHPLPIWIGANKPHALALIYNIQGSFTSHPTKALDTDGDITGPPEKWADALTHFAIDLGIDTFILAGDNDAHTLSTFIADVAPVVRDQVAEARALSPREALMEQRQLS